MIRRSSLLHMRRFGNSAVGNVARQLPSFTAPITSFASLNRRMNNSVASMVPLSIHARWCSSSFSSPAEGDAKAEANEHSNSGAKSVDIDNTLLTHVHTIAPHEPMGILKTPEEVKKMGAWPMERTRNFSIIAHIDHGKTTLADAILRRCGLIKDSGDVGRYMDKLQVERERGITVKAQTCSIFVKDPRDGKEYLLNLIDTPGHVDFSYEVSRSLGASEGAVLLVDASQGIEAQTMANLYLALDNDLSIVPALTKLDAVLSDTAVESSLTQIEDSTGLLRTEVVLTAAKKRLGVEHLLKAVIDRVPTPATKGSLESPESRALLFDCWANPDEKVGGIVALVRVLDGKFEPKTNLHCLNVKKRLEVKEVGIMNPEMVPTQCLSAGMVGYIVLPGAARTDMLIGDTFASTPNAKAVPGFKHVKPMVFAGFFPDEGQLVTSLRTCVENLRVNDPSVTVEPIECPALGSGLQLGFLGMLHMQVFQERLFNEYWKTVLVTPAQARYMYQDAEGKRHDLTLYNWKGKHEGAQTYLEPFVKATVICNNEHFAAVNAKAIMAFRSECLDQKQLDGTRIVAQYRMPLADLVKGFFDFLKQETHGYGHLEYDDPVFEEADLVKIEIVVNKASISALSTIAPRQTANETARRIVRSLRENLNRAIIDLPIQAFIGGKCIARETVGAYSKDVTAKIHAGDISRKQKKWDQQKKGKAAMAKRMVGSAQLDQETIAAAMGATFVRG